MTTQANQCKGIFDHLRVLEFGEGEARTGFSQSSIYIASDTSIEIFTAEIKPGRWAWGYNTYDKHGKNSYRIPSLEYGYCRSERDAKLFILGVLLANGHVFVKDALVAIGNEIKKLQQLSLF